MALIQELKHLKIPLEDIKLATNNFSDENFIGQGGFGRVYRGQLSNTTVAVKRLDVKLGGQGQREFLMEIAMLASYKHQNLVSLVGFSNEGVEMIIVYEHVLHGSLDKYIATTDLTWVQRLQICLGAARGINYLHSGVGDGHRVLHRDIKSSNVLLDEDWEAKISDLGLCKIGPTNQQFTFVVTNAAGTIGYVDPQYVNSGVLTKESDVFSFGVVLFEVLCGRLATDSRYEDERRFLSRLAKLRYREGRLDELIIPSLRSQMNPNSLSLFCAIAYECLKEERNQRPTMELITEQLQVSLECQIACRRIIGLWGSSTGGAPWSLRLDNNLKLKKIIIDHEDWIYSIGFTTENSSGLLDSSQHHGGYGGRSRGEISQIKFDADEEITEILGTVGVTTGDKGHVVITSLSLITTKNTKGPFGKKTGTPFSVQCDAGSFGGFYGRAGFYLDGLGCYLN